MCSRVPIAETGGACSGFGRTPAVSVGWTGKDITDCLEKELDADAAMSAKSRSTRFLCSTACSHICCLTPTVLLDRSSSMAAWNHLPLKWALSNKQYLSTWIYHIVRSKSFLACFCVIHQQFSYRIRKHLVLWWGALSFVWQNPEAKRLVYQTSNCRLVFLIFFSCVVLIMFSLI